MRHPPPAEEEGVVETLYEEGTIGKIGSEVYSRKKGGMEEVLLRFGFISHWPTLISLVIN